MKNISDYDFSRISAFLDGELNADEIISLVKDMQTKPELKEMYFSLVELSEVSADLKPLGFKERLSKISLQDVDAQDEVAPVVSVVVVSVAVVSVAVAVGVNTPVSGFKVPGPYFSFSDLTKVFSFV